jgi:hypothetical protein
MSSLEHLALELPAHWIEEEPHDGLREFWARADGSTGLLQVSEIHPEQLKFVSEQSDLGALAAELGRQLGARGQNWGTPAASKQGECSSGRDGFAIFRDGQYPAMLLWVTLSADSAFMWTWLGPDPRAQEIAEAVAVVLGARTTG